MDKCHDINESSPQKRRKQSKLNSKTKNSEFENGELWTQKWHTLNTELRTLNPEVDHTERLRPETHMTWGYVKG